MDDILDAELASAPTTKPLYRTAIIAWGTALGGPLATGYYFASNYNAFNEPEKARQAWMYSIGISVVLFGAMLLIPGAENIPGAVIPIATGITSNQLAKSLQGTQIQMHTDRGGRLYSWGRGIVISILAAIVSLIVVVGAAMALGIE